MDFCTWEMFTGNSKNGKKEKPVMMMMMMIEYGGDQPTGSVAGQPGAGRCQQYQLELPAGRTKPFHGI